MVQRTRFHPLSILVLSIIVGCGRAEAPSGPPRLDIAGTENNATIEGGRTRELIKGFNPTNPQAGDAIVATFYWLGTRNVIDSVTDVLASTPFTRVGNTYHLVERVRLGGLSMATYVATNVQNFPSGITDPGGSQILAVRADLSDSVHGGVVVSSYSGVYPGFERALDEHHSAAGMDSTDAVASAGSVQASAGALLYGVTASNALVGLDRPADFTSLGTVSDLLLKSDAGYTVSPTTSPVVPQWIWHFSASPTQPRTWLASILMLNQAPTHLVFTQQPVTTRPCPRVFRPTVWVAAMDDKGNITRAFNEPVTLSVKRDGQTLAGILVDSAAVDTASRGVARFRNLCAMQPGRGYQLVATTPFRSLSAESAPFDVVAP